MHFHEAALQRHPVEVEVAGTGCVRRCVVAEGPDVVGGDHAQLRGPQIGIDLAGPVDPVVAGLRTTELAGESDQDGDAIAVRTLRAGPGLVGNQSAADHVGVEKVEPGLEVAGGAGRIVGNRRFRCYRPVALLIEQV